MPNPKVESLLHRIASKIAGRPNLAEALARFPDPISECWIWTGGGSTPTIRVGNTTTTVVRALIEVACEEKLGDHWTPRRKPTCCSLRCVNPTHYELKPHNQNRYGMEGPHPAKLASAGPNDVREALDLMEEWGDLTSQEFKARCATLHIYFSDTVIDAAYATSSAKR